MDLMHTLELLLEYLVEIAILVFEFIGVGVIIYAGVKSGL